MDARLKDKVIVVAGAGGIGDELARRYAREGAAVVVGDVDGAAATRVAAEIAAAGGRAIGLAMDCREDGPIAEAVALATSEFGGLDGFHANFTWVGAGDAGDILDLPMDAFDAAMRVDMRGYVLCSRHAIPPMLARGGGAMLYTTSASAYIGEPTRLAYAMSKASIHALMRHVATRFGPQGIRANVIAPGLMWHAKLAQYISEEMAEEFKQANLLKARLGAPGDIAAMAALLMADEGAYITGQVINVDGGRTMRP
jgi:NAD(P)-dependent dehydrogenase (short-subunit alcohol dehydrogenase family)